MREPPGIKNILDLGLGRNYAGVYNIIRLVHCTSLLNTFKSTFNQSGRKKGKSQEKSKAKSNITNGCPDPWEAIWLYNINSLKCREDIFRTNIYNGRQTKILNF